jgi:hypothetical protein
MPTQVKIGQEAHKRLSRSARRIGMPQAELNRRAIWMYTTIIEHPLFWRVVQKLNGRKLADVIVELLKLWVTGEIVLSGDEGVVPIDPSRPKSAEVDQG